MSDGGRSHSMILSVSTLVAAVFVAIQAWYARVAFVEASATRLLEDKLALCFENFDAAVALDSALRVVAPGNPEVWPPQVVVRDPAVLARVQAQVVPLLNVFESGLTKASILGPLDQHRAYLSQTAEGLSQRLLMVAPERIGEAGMDGEIDAVFAGLSEFLGAQYLVFTGCRLVAEGKD